MYAIAFIASTMIIHAGNDLRHHIRIQGHGAMNVMIVAKIAHRVKREHHKRLIAEIGLDTGGNLINAIHFGRELFRRWIGANHHHRRTRRHLNGHVARSIRHNLKHRVQSLVLQNLHALVVVSRQLRQIATRLRQFEIVAVLDANHTLQIVECLLHRPFRDWFIWCTIAHTVRQWHVCLISGVGLRFLHLLRILCGLLRLTLLLCLLLLLR
mmetsp:Transcript_45491/g.75564  ORF Transcript_45491/g.75564 Transcript_45491/m.75564 type:complete len:211 (-) Transcript_45491:345-977(-)